MLNKAMLIGRLGADPEVRFMTNGNQVTNLRLATSRKWKDRNTNERKEETEWHRVVLYSGLAAIAAEYLKKGSQCHIEGRIKTTKWQGQDGTDKYTTEIIAESLILLDSASNNSGGQYSKPQQQSGSAAAPPAGGGGYEDFDDDIPF